MNTKIKNTIIISTICLTLSILFSCKSTEVVNTENLTHAQLIQNGQDQLAKGKYKEANQYYMASLEKFGSDLKCYVEARYEIAHCFYKQKKYENAKTMYNEILTIFDSKEAMYQVQPKYKKLAQMGLDKINALETKEQK